MATLSSEWSRSTLEKLGTSSDQTFKEIRFPFLTNGINNPEDLTQSFQIANLKTHIRIILFKPQYYTAIREFQDDLDPSQSLGTWSTVPPSSPEISRHLQEAIHASYRSLREHSEQSASQKVSTEFQQQSETLDEEELLTQSVVDLSDSLVEDRSTAKKETQQLFVHWRPVANAVLNEALGTFAQNDHVTAVCARLTEALSCGFLVREPSQEDEDWVVVD